MQSESPAFHKHDVIFYDGTCGLCHGFVKWVLAHDANCKFQFAPLQGETIKEMIPADVRSSLPDTVVVVTRERQLLTRSSAAEYLAREMRVRWLSGLLRITPRWIADFGYAVIARARYQIFGRETQSCPLLPPELRGRFLP